VPPLVPVPEEVEVPDPVVPVLPVPVLVAFGLVEVLVPLLFSWFGVGVREGVVRAFGPVLVPLLLS
jgi:hypothetical protein